jgi:hypothetical protein
MAQEYPLASVPLSDPRVRSTSARLRALIRNGSELSPTFKGLLASIEATDGIVYVDEGTCPHGVSACLAHQVTLAGRYRILFVRLDTRNFDRALIALIGHELQHALEVLANPQLTSGSAIQSFYGVMSSDAGAIETPEAVRAGFAVFDELQRSRSGKKP